MIAAKTMGANVVSQNNKPCTGGGATKKRTGACAGTDGPHPALRWTSGRHTRKPVAQFDAQTGKLTLNGRQCREEIIRLPRPRPKDALQ